MLFRVAVLSDLHVDVDPWEISAEALKEIERCDAAIIAGDISDDAFSSIEWIGQRIRRTPVFFVFGNHEDHGKSPREEGRLLARRLAEENYRNITILDREVARFNGIDILGCTLWTDFEAQGNLAENLKTAARIGPDHKAIAIKDEPGLLTPEAMRALHIEDRRWLARELEARQQREKVVVTHYPPLLKSILLDPNLAELAPLMGGDLPFLFGYEKLQYWVHGHIHHRCEYMIGKTAVLANPRGAHPFKNQDFNEIEVIEIYSR